MSVDTWRNPSISAALRVALSRSPITPEELSPSKNIFSPARLARQTMTSASKSVFQRVKVSSARTDDTIPR